MSSLKDLASLIMVPSLYKDGELHTVKPLADENIIVHPDATDNNDGVDGTTPSTSSNFTFSRGSNLAATRVDVNGLIEKGRENLLLHSNTLDNGDWLLTTNTTITGGQSGYDGTNDAWLLTKDNTLYRAIYQNLSISGVWTLSIYAKAGTLNQVTLRDSDSQGRVEFNLSDGSVDNVRTENIIAYDISSVGNDWYRCQVSFSGTTSRIQYYADFGGTTAGNIYIQDAQLEQGLVATDYIETGTSAAQSGILEDMPRLDYSGGASCPSLLLEPQRSNLVPQSEYFSSSDYTLDSITTTNNAVSSPEGVNNACEITRTSASGNARLILGNRVVSSGAKVCISIFAKENTANDIILYNTISTQGKRFDLSNGTAGDDFVNAPDDFGIEDYGNGWYRCYIVVTAPSTTMNSWIYISEASTSSVYFYGQQMEEGSYPTSYIPTYGTSQTRSGDVCIDAGGASLFNVNQGVVFGEFSALADDLTFRQFGIAGTNGNEVNLSLDAVSNRIGGIVRSNFTYYTLDYVVADTTQINKVALRYEGSVIKLFVNGSLVNTLTNAAAPLDLLEFNFGIGTGNFNKFYGKMNQVAIFPTALTDSECIALTTI